MKGFPMFVFLALVTFPSVMGSPIRKRNTSQNYTIPSFLLSLYQNVASSQSSLAQYGAKRVHGVWATATKIANTQANEVDLTSPLNGTSLPLNQTFLVNLHLAVQAPSVQQQGDCNLVIHDIKSSAEVASEIIPCASSTQLVLPVTTYIKTWLKDPSSNAGMKVNISPKDGNSSPISSVPFISTSPSVESPYYILFV